MADAAAVKMAKGTLKPTAPPLRLWSDELGWQPLCAREGCLLVVLGEVAAAATGGFYRAPRQQ